MTYYPVIIPTLNRAEHLKRCIESLMKNTGADNTELYVSVDFPPSEKYKEGYEKVKKLLSDMDLSGFKKANIFYQESNLGPGKNSDFLKNIVEKKYDAYIYSEDDNEFSKNFLEFINKGLEEFRNDDRVLAICGSADTDWETDGCNATFVKLFAAYGVGIWIEKRQREQEEGREIIVPEKPYSPKVMRKLYKQNAALFCHYILSVLTTDTGLFWSDPNTLNWCDTIHSLYMHLSDKVCVSPKTAKSRTWGNDGSGVNMLKIDIDVEKETPIDSDDTFDYDDISKLRFIEKNYKKGSEYLTVSSTTVLKAVIFYIVILLFGKNRKGAVNFLKQPRKIWKIIKNNL